MKRLIPVLLCVLVAACGGSDEPAALAPSASPAPSVVGGIGVSKPGPAPPAERGTEPNDTDTDGTHVAVAYRGGGLLQVRSVAAPDELVWETTTAYPTGRLTCLHVDGGLVLWWDVEESNEQIPVDNVGAPVGARAPAAAPGPLRIALWRHDLNTGRSARVTEQQGGPGTSCPVGSGGVVAWNTDATHVIVTDLASGATRRVAVSGRVLDVRADGSLLLAGRSDISLLARDGSRRVLRSGEGILASAADAGHLVWTETETPGQGVRVLACSLPACAREVAIGRGLTTGQPVAGGTFAAWDEGDGGGPHAARYDGRAVALPGEALVFDTLAASGDTLVWISTDPSGEEQLHVQQL